ncbi:MAG TPA: DNA repair protein RadA [Syntrophorhabdaceae bacterium]|nr:DNA repair protein RadA [Syntrophorhabdaceae bacterium]HPU29157.1 DNA repair protein RadA [Syntrophorhabdaceae bacterium]
MSKKTLFICENCGYETYKWMGRCPRCSLWDSMKEVAYEKEMPKAFSQPLIMEDEDLPDERIILGIEELDRVLGGGMTKGSSILLGGDPGIGKSTLCFEIASKIVEMGYSCLYVSGEESAKQLIGRKKRLSLKGKFPILTTNYLDDIISAINAKVYDLVIIDSIQSIYNTRLSMLPGTISQIKDVSSRLVMEMKSKETTHIFIGHVTKEGMIAGPKILEHMVDTVLYFEGDKMLPYRILRVTKNRFGPIDEVGIFQMKRDGLISVENPSDFFVSERENIGRGSTLFPFITGTRPLLLEVQAVTPKTNFSMPRRLSIGYDLNRLFIIIAIVEKAMGRPLYDRDIYINITGGIKVTEPGVDLPVAVAIMSDYLNLDIGRDTAVLGEIGLTGEIRKIVNMDLRIKECVRLGIKRVLCPKGVENIPEIELVPLKNVKSLFEYLVTRR